MRFTSVVFPAPFEPMSASTSPSVTVKSTWSTAWVSPKDLVSCSVSRMLMTRAPSGSAARAGIAVPTMPAGSARTSSDQHDPSTICQYTVWPTA